MERKIGEIFEYNGEWYQCVEDSLNRCVNCCFFNGGYKECSDELGECSKGCRGDETSVIFKKLEKVGEPYPNAGKLYQLYKLPMNIEKLPPHTEGINLVRFDMVEIVIKQTKEDMEENKTIFPKEDNALTRTVYDYVNGKISDKELIRSIKEMSDEYTYNKNNLKPFSLELAKQGKPVCTRDGRKARIICFDRRLFYKNVSYPILALVEDSDGEDCVCGYNEKGKGLIEDAAEYKDDLMMLPEKKEGWININKDAGLFKSREEAERNCTKDYATVRVEFEI